MNTKIFLGTLAFVAFVVGLFYLSNQDTEAPTNDKVGQFAEYAASLGMDTVQFTKDAGDSATKKTVFVDVAAGNEKKINSTPTFFVNGEKVNRLDETVIANHRARGKTQTLPEGRPVRGAQSPTVLIEEFSDFQCPACAAQAVEVKALLEKFPNDVALVYRHFPLTSIHDYAETAARAAEAAHLQGKFWEMHDILFEKQDEWSQ